MVVFTPIYLCSVTKQSTEILRFKRKIFLVNFTARCITLQIAHLKSGWGDMVGICPSMTPLSLIDNTPPGSRRALSRSSTDGLEQTEVAIEQLYINM